MKPVVKIMVTVIVQRTVILNKLVTESVTQLVTTQTVDRTEVIAIVQQTAIFLY